VDPKGSSLVVSDAPVSHRDGDEHIVSDLTLPTPPEPQHQHNEVLPVVDLVVPHVQAPVEKVGVEDRAYKNYRVGEFKTLTGGKENLLEIFDCDCHISQLSVRLEKEGKQVVFQRTIRTSNNMKQQVQRFTVPYILNPDRVDVKYGRDRDGGTLSLLLTKPDPSAGGTAGGSLAGEFTKFTISAVAGSQGKVTMKASQTKEYFQFEASGEPKLDTEVIGELAEGDQVKFHAITTDLEANVKKKATQTFNLPAKVTLDHFELSDGGRAVKVHDKKVASKGPSSSHAHSPEVQPDVDIKIVAV